MNYLVKWQQFVYSKILARAIPDFWLFQIPGRLTSRIPFQIRISWFFLRRIEAAYIQIRLLSERLVGNNTFEAVAKSQIGRQT